ncbi:hypothetical protein DPMN_121744 [Dreissena polymorpha]|uniref:Uncharacterized protein n=1 Tax=Dreissena polymorpha TaxID=45954 RepID=A0A9D4GN19_DREPO|nr:hypothetical protein DPMN_121744 [Dreissena polymorpha]
MRVYRELSDTWTDTQPDKIEDHHTWLQTVKISIAENCEQIVSFADEYTVYTIVILWPKTEEIILFIRKFLDKIVYELNHKPKLVVCMNEKCRSADEETALNELKMEYSSCIHVCIIDFSDLCLGIGSKLQGISNRCLKYELPRMPIDILPGFITEKDAMWLKEDLEVLYLQNPNKVTDADHDFLETEIINFIKGGRFPWSAWYEIGDSGVDIRRDSLKDAIQKIDQLMSQSRCSTITILNAPGSGGSTLAQRILWEYHQKIPCVQVRRGTLLKSKDLSRKIEFIHERTHLTTLILIDDEDDAKVKQFC